MEIEKFDKILTDLTNHFASKADVGREQIFDALVLLLSDNYEFEWAGDLWSIEIEYEEAIRLISKFDFGVFRQTIKIEDNVFPEHLLLQYKVRFKSKGTVWVIHRYDADPFPSNPHAHQLDNNLKLDLSNGKCYKKKELVATVRKKDLIAIREAAEKVFDGELPPLVI